MRRVVVVAVLLLGGCATCPVVEPVRIVEPVEVMVPVPIVRRPPAELLAPLALELPEFVSPAAAGTTSALTAEGERRLRVLLLQLRARLQAWEAWAVEPGGTSAATP